MIVLNDNELVKVTGGFSLSGTLISAIAKAFKIVFEIGQSLGTSINMIKHKTTCKG